jgi:hypothetical protein
VNIHIVVEGDVGEKKLYQCWVPFVNPALSYVSHISDIVNNNFSIISGGGYPQYLSAIVDNAIADVNTVDNIDRLVIAVDSEDMSYEEKYNEIQQLVSRSSCHAVVKIVIQHFCLETWALGNEVIIRQHPQCDKLRQYMRLYNVRIKDPELLPPHSQEQLNRAQFAEKYLRRALNDKYKRLSYSKGNPQVLLHSMYFERVKHRCKSSNHIQSFRNFLEAFV